MWRKVLCISLTWIKNILVRAFTIGTSKQFFSLPLQSFNSEALEKFSVEYLRNLKCEELSVIYDKLPGKYKADDIIRRRSLRCHSHWPTDGDVPDCPPPFKINCKQCILSKVSSHNTKVEEVIRRHLYGHTDFRNFPDDEIKYFPLFYLTNNIKGEHLLEKWYAIPEKFKAGLQSKLPCLEHNPELNNKYIYKYECYQCLYDK